MGTLSTELGKWMTRAAREPRARARVYADANVPAGLVGYMRTNLGWDVLFVLEHDDLRRAKDGQHYRLARQLLRLLVTLDRDYLDDRRFPLEQSGGVFVLSAPDEAALARVLRGIDRRILRPSRARGGHGLLNRKFEVGVDGYVVRRATDRRPDIRRTRW